MSNDKGFSTPITLIVYALWLVFVIYAHASGRNQAVQSTGDLSFFLDTASFRSSTSQTYQEFYYQIPLSQLRFNETEQGYIDTVLVSILLIDSLGRKVYNDSSIIPVFASKLTEIESSFLPDQFDLILEPGRYTLEFSINEISTGSTGRVTQPFSVLRFDNSIQSISDIQFASGIEPDTARSKFFKNGFRVMPNPGRVYGFSHPMLYFYFEVYNLSPPQGDTLNRNTFRIEYDILDVLGDVVKSFPAKTKKKSGTSSAEVGAVNVGMLPDTLYQLRITVVDDDTEVINSMTREFKIIPLQMPTLQDNEAAVAIGKMSDEELSIHFRQLKYLLTRDEIKLLSELSIERLRIAIINYWITNDPTPDTSANEYWQAYMGRIVLANSQFSSSFQEGWQTDRGRIMIKYGVPNDISRHPMSVDTIPYVEWIYYREEGMKFIFADEEGFNRYRLIYSSDERELTDPNWTRIIQAYQR